MTSFGSTVAGEQWPDIASSSSLGPGPTHDPGADPLASLTPLPWSFRRRVLRRPKQRRPVWRTRLTTSKAGSAPRKPPSRQHGRISTQSGPPNRPRRLSWRRRRRSFTAGLGTWNALSRPQQMRRQRPRRCEVNWLRRQLQLPTVLRRCARRSQPASSAFVGRLGASSRQSVGYWESALHTISIGGVHHNSSAVVSSSQ